MNKKLTRILSGTLSLVFVGQVMIYGDGAAQGVLHADTIASAAEAIEEGNIVEADLDNGILYNKTTGKQYKTAPFPEFIQTIITNGGLIESIKNGSVK